MNFLPKIFCRKQKPKITRITYEYECSTYETKYDNGTLERGGANIRTGQGEETIYHNVKGEVMKRVIRYRK